MTPITAPDAVVRTWREEATRAMRAAHRPDDPRIADVLRFVPRELYALVADMSDALSHASGIFLASVANATPDRCPIPDPGDEPYPCQCGPAARAGCEATVAELATPNSRVSQNTKHARMRPIELPLVVDDGCEGGVA